MMKYLCKHIYRARQILVPLLKILLVDVGNMAHREELQTCMSRERVWRFGREERVVKSFFGGNGVATFNLSRENDVLVLPLIVHLFFALLRNRGEV